MRLAVMYRSDWYIKEPATVKLSLLVLTYWLQNFYQMNTKKCPKKTSAKSAERSFPTAAPFVNSSSTPQLIQTMPSITADKKNRKMTQSNKLAVSSVLGAAPADAQGTTAPSVTSCSVLRTISRAKRKNPDGTQSVGVKTLKLQPTTRVMKPETTVVMIKPNIRKGTICMKIQITKKILHRMIKDLKLTRMNRHVNASINRKAPTTNTPLHCKGNAFKGKASLFKKQRASKPPAKCKHEPLINFCTCKKSVTLDHPNMSKNPLDAGLAVGSAADLTPVGDRHEVLLPAPKHAPTQDTTAEKIDAHIKKLNSRGMNICYIDELPNG